MRQGSGWGKGVWSMRPTRARRGGTGVTIYGPRLHPLSCLVGPHLPKLTTHQGPRVKAALYDANEITTSWRDKSYSTLVKYHQVPNWIASLNVGFDRLHEFVFCPLKTSGAWVLGRLLTKSALAERCRVADCPQGFGNPRDGARATVGRRGGGK